MAVDDLVQRFLLFLPRSSRPDIGWLFIGFFGGAILRDVGHYQVALRKWPITRQILDFKRVAELIEEAHEKAVS